MKNHPLDKMFDEIAGGATPGRVRNLVDCLSGLTEHAAGLLRIETCSDEKTGVRYGLARKRVGRCARLGGTTYQYQVWAVWD